MRNIKIAPGEHYHVFNRGIRKQIIFHNDADRIRFLFLVTHFQSPVKFPQVGRNAKSFVKYSVFDTKVENIQRIVKDRFVELCAFCLMSNHFHLILKEVEEGGISKYMHRVLEAYSKYYNTKYGKSGHLFQGPYKAVHVVDNEQLLYLSAYIHKNSTELAGWKGKEHLYPWSSFVDFVSLNRWGELLMQGIILDQFKNKKEYERFVKISTAKEIKEELGDCQILGI